MTRSRAIGALLILAAIDQAVRGLWETRAAVLPPLTTALQAGCLAAALILSAVLIARHDRVHSWQVLVAAGCLSGLLERVFFGQISLPLAFSSTGQWDWTAFAFADMYIVAGVITAYWKHELQKEQKQEGEQERSGVS